MQTILTQKALNLDHENRFFDDNKKLLEKYMGAPAKSDLRCTTQYAPKMYAKAPKNATKSQCVVPPETQ